MGLDIRTASAFEFGNDSASCIVYFDHRYGFWEVTWVKVAGGMASTRDRSEAYSR